MDGYDRRNGLPGLHTFQRWGGPPAACRCKQWLSHPRMSGVVPTPLPYQSTGGDPEPPFMADALAPWKVPPYSSRSAFTGSSAAARRAGIHDDSAAMSKNSTTITA